MTENTPLLGTWKLRAFRVVKSNGEEWFPYGVHATGQVTYSPSGRFSVVMARHDRAHFVSGDQLRGSDAEMAEAFKGYISYFGSFSFDPAKNEVVHRIESSLFPNWEGHEHRRFVKLDGDVLELTTPPTVWGGGEVVGQVQWERIG